MKKLTISILACGMLASSVHEAGAVATMRLSSDGGVTWVVVEDNGPLDTDPTLGSISFNGPVGSWTVSSASSFGSPIVGSPTTPTMDVDSFDLSTGPETLIVQMSDTNFVAFPNETFIASLGTTTGGTVVYNTYRDLGNVLFGTTSTYTGDPPGISPSPTASPLVTVGPVSNGTAVVSNGVVEATGITPYSLTLETIVVHSGAARTSTDALLYSLPPPPCNCTLTFNSPTSLSACSGDTIPAVTASEDCGSGPVSVPVTFVGARTNGTCPAIITRTNSATDDCGTVHTFVQTITVNCKPDCTITTVTAAIAGSTNISASVADAGPGATYSWTISNGTITGGQGTANITFTAGQTNNPTSIFVTVTTAAGCPSACSASIVINPPPVCSIPGVIMSNTSWNAFKIPTNTSPVIWVHLHIQNLKGIPTNGTSSIQFTGVTLTVNGTPYALPDGVLNFDSAAPKTNTVTFSGGKWVGTINPKYLSDQIFFTGAAIPVTPFNAASSKATLTYNTTATVQGLSFDWQWSGAVFTYWPADWNQAGIQPYHGGSKGYQAGTPTNPTVQNSLIAGPRGGGGSNFTGSWSATGSAQCQ